MVGSVAPDEAAQVLRLQTELFAGDPNSMTHEEISASAADPRTTILVARRGNDVLGFVTLHDRSIRPWTGIDFVGVDPSAAGQGIGARLIDGAIRHAPRPVLRLFVRPSNEAARALYDKCGFRHTGTRKANYADGEDAMVLMKWIGPRLLRRKKS